MKKLFVVSSLLWLCFALAAPAQSPSVAVTGTKAKLTPPAGFAPAKQFPGFMHEETGSSIMITEMPAPYSKIADAFTKESLAKQGMTLLAQRPHTISGRPGVFLHARQVAQNLAFVKWLVVTGTEQESVIIAGTCLEAVKAKWGAALEKAVTTAQWNADANIDQLAGLNFAIKDHPEMKIARRVTNLLMLTPSGTLPGKPTNDPMMIVGSAFSEVEIGDLKQFALARLQEITRIKNIVIKQQTSVTIAGLPGSEITAEAEWSDTQAPVTVFQIILPNEKSYFIIQGFAPRTEQQKYLAIFRGIAQSFQKK